ncbi:hypothetical protein [Barnesiella intestinihominis]|uniref:hypothetical protein n=1 Tax=Barnesiella intestinihominis TaxID=487174 RepID=UPI0039673670
MNASRPGILSFSSNNRFTIRYNFAHPKPGLALRYSLTFSTMSGSMALAANS